MLDVFPRYRIAIGFQISSNSPRLIEYEQRSGSFMKQEEVRVRGV